MRRNGTSTVVPASTVVSKLTACAHHDCDGNGRESLSFPFNLWPIVLTTGVRLILVDDTANVLNVFHLAGTGVGLKGGGGRENGQS